MRVNAPRVARVNSPPRFTVLPPAVMVPALLQVRVLPGNWSPKLSVPPLALIVAPAALLQAIPHMP